eukprot:scaffold6843_cov149-Isochrysis_galbana.AAC.6
MQGPLPPLAPLTSLTSHMRRHRRWARAQAKGAGHRLDRRRGARWTGARCSPPPSVQPCCSQRLVRPFPPPQSLFDTSELK